MKVQEFLLKSINEYLTNDQRQRYIEKIVEEAKENVKHGILTTKSIDKTMELKKVYQELEDLQLIAGAFTHYKDKEVGKVFCK